MHLSSNPIRMRKSRLKRAILVCLSGFLLALWPALCPAQTTAYSIKTAVGDGTGGIAGDGNDAVSAELYGPRGLAIDDLGNIYIADQFNHRIRKISVTDGSIITVAGSGTIGAFGDGDLAVNAELRYPCGVAVDTSGNIYIADTGNHVIRKVDGDHNIWTIAGQYTNGYSGDNGAATHALLNRPTGLAVAADGTLYISDSGNHVIRRVTIDGKISTYVGTGKAGYDTYLTRAQSAMLNNPQGLALDANGILYIADSSNHLIRSVDTNETNGVVKTVAGKNLGGFEGDGGLATDALLYYPKGVRVDSSGNLYIADTLNNRIRLVTSNGYITTIAGMGSAGYWGDGALATNALLAGPSDVLFDETSSSIYLTDTDNHRLRVLTALAGYPSVSLGGVVSASAFGGFTSVAPGSWIEIYGSSLASTTREWQSSDFKGVVAPTSLDGTSVRIGGKAAYVSYISPGQVNVQVPSTVGVGSQQLTVTTKGGTSSPVDVTVNATQPGLLAPSAIKINGKQYVGAFLDGDTYVLPTGAVAGITSRRAKVWDTIVLYGVGFGSVLPDTAAGRIVQGTNTLELPLKVLFDGTEATVAYDGLMPGMVGLYQFNVVVPNIASSDVVPLTFTLGGVAGTQTLYTSVGN
jgi:uncharacterized protein (TIGR03437 family)